MSNTGGVAADQLRAFVERLSVEDYIAFASKIECWKEIDGFPGYLISSFGRIRGKQGEVLQQGVAHGYKTVSMMTSGQAQTKRVSRLVLKAFIGAPIFKDAHAAHNDGNKENNNLGNLRWATAIENQSDIDRHGTRVCGSEVRGSKLTEEEIPKIRERIRSGERYPSIAKDFGVSISTISLIKKERIWRHVG